jgi:2-keto-4-pentenoate hydratase
MAADSGKLREIADLVLAARQSSRRLQASDLARVVDGPEAAYEVQRLVSLASGSTLLGEAAGYKIGMSKTAAVLANGPTEPVFGRFPRSRLLQSGAVLMEGRKRLLAVECEIAIRLNADLPARGRPYGPEDVRSAVESYHVGIEILEDRFVKPGSPPPWVLVADDMLAFGGVLGKPIDAFAPDMPHFGSISVDGQLHESGSTAELFGGGPLSCLAWLANRAQACGQPCRAGDVIFSGGITAPFSVGGDDANRTEIRAEIDRRRVAELTISWAD